MLPNLDQLTLLLGGFFALLLLVALVGLIYLIGYVLRERRKRAWQEFARTNDLSLKRGHFPRGASVTGAIDEHRLSLKTTSTGSWPGSRALTQMTLVAASTSDFHQNGDAAVVAAANLIAAIYHNALTRPYLRRLHQESQKSRPFIIEFLRFFWRLGRGKSAVEAFSDDDGSEPDFEKLQESTPILTNLVSKVIDTYGVDPARFAQGMPHFPFGPDFTNLSWSDSNSDDMHDHLEAFHHSLEQAAAPALRGQIELEEMGRIVTYRQIGLETEVGYLQLVLHFLTSLAEAYPLVMDLGMELAPFLQEMATQENDLQPVVFQLMRDITAVTQSRLGHAPERFLCLRCLTCCGAHELILPTGQTLTYYGCRTCRQSRTFFEGEVVMFLNDKSATEQAQQDGVLRVNWYADRTLFDFDAVEIIHAGDEDVERFAVQVGNDTDPVRQPRYEAMRCVVSPKCQLSQNTRRILARTFGEVTHGES